MFRVIICDRECQNYFVHAGAGPYKQWEKQPLFDDNGEASSTSANEEEDLRKEHGSDRIVSKRTMQYLIWFNCALFLLVVGGFTILVRSLCQYASINDTNAPILRESTASRCLFSAQSPQCKNRVASGSDAMWSALQAEARCTAHARPLVDHAQFLDAAL